MAIGSRLPVWSVLLISLFLTSQVRAQQANSLGEIIGNIQVLRGDFPAYPVLVSLEMRGAPINSAYTKALSFSPNYYPAHNNLGSAYLGRQKFNEAQAQFEAALKANQNDVEAYFNLANLLVLTQHYDEAQREINEGLKRRPDSAFGKFLQGSVYTRTGRPDLAEKSLQSALQLDPKMLQAYLQLVNLYLQQKRTPEAISQLEAYLKAFPDSPFSPKARDLLKRLQGDAGTSTNPQ